MSWALDSGASSHMCSQHHAFSSLTSMEPGEAYVNAYGGEPLAVRGRGKIDLVLRNGDRVTLINVLYVPGGSNTSLISLGQCQAAGCRIEGDGYGNQLSIISTTGAVMTGTSTPSSHRLYFFYARLPTLIEREMKQLYCLQAAARSYLAEPSYSTKATLWHERLGHTAYSGMQRMLGAVQGMDVTAQQLRDAATHTCEVCVATKLAATPHSPQPHSTQRPLELVHTDVAGPTHTHWRQQHSCTTSCQRKWDSPSYLHTI